MRKSCFKYMHIECIIVEKKKVLWNPKNGMVYAHCIAHTREGNFNNIKNR